MAAPTVIGGRAARSPLAHVVAGTLLVLAGLGGGAEPAAAQDGCICDPQCDFLVTRTLPGIGSVTYISGVRFLCEGDVRITADSAVAYGDRGYSELLGRVRYRETSREMSADEARYFSNEGRLQAQGNVRVRDDEQGSSIENGDLVYLLETDFREVAEMTVTTGADRVRPVAFLLPSERDEEGAEGLDADDSAGAPAVDPRDSVAVEPQDSAATPLPTGLEPPPEPDTTPPTPYRVESDRIYLRGAGFFNASGSVEIVRDSLFAYGDSAVYDEAGEGLVLEGRARVDGSSYELVGRRIAMSGPDSDDSTIEALREARLVGADFDLTAARIVAFLVDDAMERLVATPIVRPGPGVEVADSAELERPRALVEDFELTADSLEVLAPGEVLERVFAAGRARSFSTSGDSLNVELLPEIARTDWLEGDTVIVTFREREADAEREVDAIVAVVAARSLYRIPPRDSTAVAGTDPPAVHYVTGDSIRIQMRDGEIEGMRVAGQTRGVHFEPLRRAAAVDTATAADTSAVADSAAARDTSGVDPAPARREHRSRQQQGERDDPPFSEEHPWKRH